MRNFGLLTLALFLSTCSTQNDPLFCDESTPCANGVETFCDIDKVYTGTEYQNECIAPPSATACNRVEACSDSTLHCSDIDMGAIGQCVPCVDASHCTGVGEVCNTTTNECEVLPCTVDAAGDDICLAAAPAKPYCVVADTCGECRPDMNDCSGNAANAQVCDAENFACRGCVSNDECTLSDLCDTGSAECANESDLLYVVATGGSDAGLCTRAAPCATIQKAIDLAADGRNTILVGAGSYPEQLVVDGKPATLLGQGVVTVNPDLGNDQRAVVAINSATVSLLNLSVSPDANSDSGSDAVECNNATLSLTNVKVSGARDVGVFSINSGTLTLTQSTVEGNTGIGISSTGGTLTLTQSTVSGNDGGGISITSSDFTIVNNFFTKNGAGDADIPGVSLVGGGTTQQFDFNTIAENIVNGNTALASGMDCRLSAAMTGIGNIIYDGVAISGSSPDLNSNNCNFEYSDIEGLALTGSNVDIAPSFFNVGNGDYHLASNSPLIGAAAGATTVPDEDIDGDARPAGAADIGADQYTSN